jgi:hypothetical protein
VSGFCRAQGICHHDKKRLQQTAAVCRGSAGRVAKGVAPTTAVEVTEDVPVDGIAQTRSRRSTEQGTKSAPPGDRLPHPRS